LRSAQIVFGRRRLRSVMPASRAAWFTTWSKVPARSSRAHLSMTDQERM
jgi:hypothetical protein